MKPVYYETDVLVIGGGLPGVCAAIASSRGGAKTIILERSLTLGGNCGPEIGVHPSDGHRYHPYMAATGIVAELIESANKACAKTDTADYHYNICLQWDRIMSEALEDAGVKVLRRHYAHTPVVEDGKITEVCCEDTATYNHVCIKVKNIVIDASGDGNVSAQAGAIFSMGREGKDEFGERLAPDVGDDVTLGSSLVALVRKTDHEVKFIPPKNTPEFFPGYWGDIVFKPNPDETLKFFFPTESGGELNTIEDEHEIYENLLGQLYSAWNRVKNVTHTEESKNWELLWVSTKIGKRESRRFKGDYVLNGNDIESGRVFDDAIAVGGFYTDVHYPNPANPKYVNLIVGSVPPTYTIPYRSIYSENISNLMFASRLMSVSHLAHASVRVQRTLSSVAHATGAAAAMCCRKQILPREIGRKYIDELQQILIAQDACIPIKQKNNLAAEAAVIKASSELKAEPEHSGQYVKIQKDMGIQLWSFQNHIENIKLYIKSNTENTIVLKLLRYKNEEPWQHERMPFGTFDKFEIANETEWGLDNRCEKFVELAQSEAHIHAGFAGEINFDFKIDLEDKDIMSDEDKLMILFADSYDAEVEFSEGEYDYARMVNGVEDEMYRVTDATPIFRISPQIPYGQCENIKNGYTRRFSTNPMNMWKPQSLPATLEMSWNNVQHGEYIDIYFDTIMRTYHEEPFECKKDASPQCAKEFEVCLYKDGTPVKREYCNNNVSRKYRIKAGVDFDKIDITIYKCHETALPGIYKFDIIQERHYE